MHITVFFLMCIVSSNCIFQCVYNVHIYELDMMSYTYIFIDVF